MKPSACAPGCISLIKPHHTPCFFDEGDEIPLDCIKGCLSPEPHHTPCWTVEAANPANDGPTLEQQGIIFPEMAWSGPAIHSSSPFTQDQELRLAALGFAVQARRDLDSTTNIKDNAIVFYNFLKGN